MMQLKMLRMIDTRKNIVYTTRSGKTTYAWPSQHRDGTGNLPNAKYIEYKFQQGLGLTFEKRSADDGSFVCTAPRSSCFGAIRALNDRHTIDNANAYIIFYDECSPIWEYDTNSCYSNCDPTGMLLYNTLAYVPICPQNNRQLIIFNFLTRDEIARILDAHGSAPELVAIQNEARNPTTSVILIPTPNDNIHTIDRIDGYAITAVLDLDTKPKTHTTAAKIGDARFAVIGDTYWATYMHVIDAATGLSLDAEVELTTLVSDSSGIIYCCNYIITVTSRIINIIDSETYEIVATLDTYAYTMDVHYILSTGECIVGYDTVYCNGADEDYQRSILIAVNTIDMSFKYITMVDEYCETTYTPEHIARDPERSIIYTLHDNLTAWNENDGTIVWKIDLSPDVIVYNHYLILVR